MPRLRDARQSRLARRHGVGNRKIIERKGRRPAGVHVSPQGAHYSRESRGVRFIHLGIVVRRDKTVERRRRYAALEPLAGGTSAAGS